MGRPMGSKNQTVTSTVETAATRCKQCGSSERTPYRSTYTKALSGEFEGEPFNQIIYRHTTCVACHQNRIDKTYVMSLSPKDTEPE